MDWLAPLSGKSSMRKAGLMALAATGSSQMAKLLLNVSATLILVRILPPDDFGRFAMAALVVTFILTFKDLGLSTATIQANTKTQARFAEYGLAPAFGDRHIGSGPGFVTKDTLPKVEKYAGQYR